MTRIKQQISLLLCTAAVLAAATQTCADSIKLTNGLTYDRVTILGVADGVVRFQMRSGTTIRKSISKIAVVSITDDKNFVRGETLLQQGKHAEAEKAYSAAGRLAAAGWKKTLIDYRLLAVNNAAGQIDKATARWLKIVDDAGVSAGVLALRPRKLAPARSKANDLAIALLKAKAQKADPAYLKAIRQLLVDLYERQERLAEARVIAAQLVGKTTTPKTKPSANGKTRPETPPVGSANAQLRLASLSLKQGRYEQVVRQLQPRMKKFTVADLPSAMLLLGRAKLGLSKQKQDKSAAEKLLLEAGLDLMRVVVFFGSSDEAPYALFLAGQVNERLGNAEAAKAAYSTVANRFAKSPATKEAQKALERMKKKGTRD